jgi:hypothetical protein
MSRAALSFGPALVLAAPASAQTVYSPNSEVLDGSWTSPPVNRTE